MSPNKILKQDALKWLPGKTQEEIADKIVEVVNKVYDETVARHKMNLKEQLFKVLCEPPAKPNVSWWSFW